MSADKYLPGALGLPHYRGDVLDVLGDGWDMMIGFPPCTFISNVQNIHYNYAKWPDKTRRREAKREKAIKFFLSLKNSKIPKIALENPFPSPYALGYIGPFDQMVHPWMFGDPFSKKTCWWLKNIPQLEPTEIVHRGTFNKGTNGRTNATWYHNLSPSQNRAIERSKSFPGMMRAIAEQWA